MALQNPARADPDLQHAQSCYVADGSQKRRPIESFHIGPKRWRVAKWIIALPGEQVIVRLGIDEAFVAHITRTTVHCTDVTQVTGTSTDLTSL